MAKSEHRMMRECRTWTGRVTAAQLRGINMGQLLARSRVWYVDRRARLATGRSVTPCGYQLASLFDAQHRRRVYSRRPPRRDSERTVCRRSCINVSIISGVLMWEPAERTGGSVGAW